MKKIAWIATAPLFLWIFLGNPSETIASWFWPEAAAPWENVHAFYYPDRNNLTIDKQHPDVGSLEACRKWVSDQARLVGDANLERGDYECGIGCKPFYGDGFMCRLTIR